MSKVSEFDGFYLITFFYHSTILSILNDKNNKLDEPWFACLPDGSAKLNRHLVEIRTDIYTSARTRPSIMSLELSHSRYKNSGIFHSRFSQVRRTNRSARHFQSSCFIQPRLTANKQGIVRFIVANELRNGWCDNDVETVRFSG